MDAREAGIKRLAPDPTQEDHVEAADRFLAWTRDHPSLERVLAKPGSIPSFRDLALNNSLADLVAAIGRGSPPADVPGDTRAEKRSNFARQLRAGLFEREPTAVLQRMVQDDEIPVSQIADPSGVVQVLTNLGAGFDIRKDSLASVLNAPNVMDGVPVGARAGVMEALKTLQRVQAISPTPETVAALVRSGDHSAFSVAQTPRDQFLRRMQGQLDAAAAAATHQNALRVQIRNEDALAAIRQQIIGSGMAVVDGSLPRTGRLARVQKAADATGVALDVQGLFGDLDFCECDDCLSVFSPAAYFVELLQYLRNNNLDPTLSAAPGIAGTTLEKLLRRRPDLGCLQLTCENTNTVLPYVDLVNEVMESFVVHLGSYATDTHDPKQASIDVFNVENETSGELQAQPQHVNYDAYCLLKSAVFPTGLPYHQPIDRMRIWLRAMKTTRFDVLDRFRTGLPERDMAGLGPSDLAELTDLYAELRQRAADAEYLGLTQEQYVILTRQAFPPRRYLELSTGQLISASQYRQKIGLRPVHEYFGYGTEQEMLDVDETTQVGLTFVKKQLLPRAGVTYTDLVDVLKTHFINPAYPSGPALRLTLAVRASYRFLQTLVDRSSTDPKRRFAKLIDYLVAHAAVAPGLSGLVTDDPCGSVPAEDRLDAAQITRWVRCYFERLGQLIVLDAGEQPRLPIAGDLYAPYDGEWTFTGTLSHDGTVVDKGGALIATTSPTGQVLLTAGETPIGQQMIRSVEGFVIGGIDEEGFLVRPGEDGARIDWLPPADSCDLDTVRLVHLDGSPVKAGDYDRIQRLIRLWRSTGWSIPQTDQALTGLGATAPTSSGAGTYESYESADDSADGDDAYSARDDLAEDCTSCAPGECADHDGRCPPTTERAKITPAFLRELTNVKRIMERTGLDVDRVLGFWDDVGTAGEKSPYARTFLRHNVLATDDVFRPDVNGLVLVNAGKLTGHLAGLQAALGLGAQDIAALMSDLSLPDTLTLDTVSVLYRHAVLARWLRLKAPELARVRAVFGDPFADAATTWQFLEDWRRMADASLTLRHLDFALTGRDDLRRPLAPSLIAVLRLTKTLFDGLTAIDQQHPDLGSDAVGLATVDLVRSQAGLLFDEGGVEAIVGLVQGSTVHTTNAPTGLAITIPPALAARVSYADQPSATPARATLSVTGILDADASAVVRALSPLPGWASALDRLAAQPRVFFEATIKPLVPDGGSGLEQLLLAGDDWTTPAGQPAPSEPLSAPGKRLAFLRALLPELRKRLAHKLVVDTMSEAAGLDADVTDVLLSDILTVGGPRRAMDALLSLKDTDAGGPGFHGYLLAPADDQYVFVADGFDTAPTALSLDGGTVAFTFQQQDPTNVWMTGPVRLRPGTLYPFDTHDLPLNQLKWRTVGRPTSGIPAGSLLADHMAQGVQEVMVKTWQAAVVLNSLSLSADECRYLHHHGADFAGWDFNAPTLAAWRRLAEYTHLRTTIKSNGDALLDLFGWASDAGASPANLVDRIVKATAWDPTQVAALVAPEGFNIPDPSSFRNEIALVRMAKALEVVDLSRAEVPQLFAWADPGSRFWPAHLRANAIQASYRARFTQDDWEKAVEPLYDELRGAQRRALIDYLVVQPELRRWGVVDADSLFEFFLIDVEMGTCRDTSRIKQAISSVQSFIQRCMLGLEADRGVPGDVLDRGRWKWMQKYRVWEANRKVFVNPESYLKAELRDDKSIFFAELEAQLLQKDINPETIAAALRSYVYQLDEVANPEPVGILLDEATKLLHIFARTRSAPHIFYYRIFDTQSTYWYPWERVTVDIPSYDGLNEIIIPGPPPAFIHLPANGCYLIPVVFKGRLLIFFPQFNRKTEAPVAASSRKNFNDFGKDNKVGDTQAEVSWEIKLAFSEFRDKKWSSKQLSTGALLSSANPGTILPEISRYIFVPRIDDNLRIDVYTSTTAGGPPAPGTPIGRFEFSGQHLEARGTAANWSPTHSVTFHYDVNDTLHTFQARGDSAPTFAGRPNLTRHFADVQFSGDTAAGTSFDVEVDDKDVPALLGDLNSGGPAALYDYYLKTRQDTEQANDLRYGGYPRDGGLLYHELKTPYALYAWELGFHAPMLLAQRLLAARQFDDALDVMHYVLNPMAKGTAEDPVWRFLPLRETDIDNDAQDLFLRLQPNTPDKDISEWRDNPFNPHVVARGRISAYKRWAAMQYVRLWIEYGDYYFRQNTLETIPLAIQCYVVASHLYGPPGQEIPKRGRTEPVTYLSLLDRWDAFSNAMVDLELAFPFSNQPGIPDDGALTAEPQPANLFGTASSLYFCIPSNPEIRALRATIDDRLGKIRACQDINGVYTPLPLFEAELDPNLLVAAAAAGLSIASVLNDLDAPMPNYRFTYLLQKALEACAELKTLGAASLAAKEKGDAETLAHLRATHEQAINTLVMQVRTQQLEEATRAKTTLLASRASAVYRLQHQIKLIGEDLSKVPAGGDFTEFPELMEPPQDVSGLKLMALEKEELDKASSAKDWQTAIGVVETLASIFHAIPIASAHATPIGMGLAVSWGGSNLGNLTQAVARGLQVQANSLSFESTNAGRKAAFQRQLQERVQAANVAGYEITNIDKQILAQDIRIDIAQKEIDNQQRMIDNSQAVLDYLENKYTSAALYTYLDGQLSGLHYQAYTLAYEMAKKAEKLFQFERGMTDTSFIQFGYWDPARDGLLAGERLYQGLKQLETAYQNSRGHDFEVTKSISLRQLNPSALLDLRETGTCEFSLPEIIFDMDYPGHYQRRIKTIGLNLPCTLSRSAGLNATVRLTSHRYRRSAEAKNPAAYPETTDQPDDRFATTLIPISAVAVSSQDNDTGTFELNLHDERYLPFEGAGVISSWRIELPRVWRQFDYRTITDVTLRLRYTSLDGGDALRQAAEGALLEYMKSIEDLSQDEGLFTAFDLINEFPDEWYTGMHPAAGATERAITLSDITRVLPFSTQGRPADKVVATDIYLFVAGDLTSDKVKASQGGVDDVTFTDAAPSGDLSVFAAHDVGAPVTDLTLTIADLTSTVEQFWVVERYTLV
jgi:Tc toxin complex TcA C-terminal TcB-binding domain/Neuraminidase-like domain/Salmonella virulence plasmid 28.1kDa A protein